MYPTLSNLNEFLRAGAHFLLLGLHSVPEHNFTVDSVEYILLYGIWSMVLMRATWLFLRARAYYIVDANSAEKSYEIYKLRICTTLLPKFQIVFHHSTLLSIQIFA